MTMRDINQLEKVTLLEKSSFFHIKTRLIGSAFISNTYSLTDLSHFLSLPTLHSLPIYTNKAKWFIPK